MSRIIKLTHYTASDESVLLSLRTPPLKTDVSSEKLQEIQQKIKNVELEAQNILRDAEDTAQNILKEASAQAELVKQQAQAEIERWWEEKRLEAEEMFTQAMADGKEQGLAIGREEGKQLALQEEHAAVESARDILAAAYAEKEKIIAEAEPFLVELSMEVAKKVIGMELATAPETVLEMVRKVLRRSRVHGHITVCVNHRYFDFLQEHRAQLLELLDGQAELSIYPDYTVHDEGCVIRTQLGSVDARIDTQLNEIKQVLLEIARGSEAP